MAVAPDQFASAVASPAGVLDDAAQTGGIDFENLPGRSLNSLSGARTHGFQMIVKRGALDRIHKHGDRSRGVEVCGVLVGEVYADEHGPFVLVEHIVEGESANSSVGQVTFTADTWQHIQSQMDRLHPTLRIVGWYHTHPGHGIFLSDMDLFIHESFFDLPWQIALVYDPIRGEDGVFSGHSGKVQRVDFLVEASESASHDDAFDQKLHPIHQPVRANKSEEPNRFFAILAKSLLALVGWGLFLIAGYLLATLILNQHVHLPHLPKYPVNAG